MSFDLLQSLPSLTVFSDLDAKNAALNMAVDEVLLQRMESPWLRHYEWNEPSISIGFSQALSKVPVEKQGYPLVRRWTGGGVVIHEGDWTYTLGVPAHVPFSDEKAGDIYRWIHEKMIQSFEHLGVDGAELQPNHTSDGMGVCFVEPAKFDVVWRGKKIAGAAQRRTKLGLMHQGTIQEVPMPQGFLAEFSRNLCATATAVQELPEAWIEEALRLVETKYGTSSWTHEKTVLAPR